MAFENSETPVRIDAAEAGKGPSVRALTIAALLLLAIGVVGGGWAANRWLGGDASVATGAMSGASRAPAPTPIPPVAAAPSPTIAAPSDPATLGARVAELEQRLSRINLAAESASGNASRAESLIIVFAVRRALDRALPLGDLDAQLTMRFGDNQPKAVATVIDTARDPVTLEQLHAGLDALGPQLAGRVEGNLWAGFRREVGELFVIRSATAPSERADERFARARRYLGSNQVDKAIEEVQAMPGAAAAADWLIDARRYHEARRALDLIETAALVEPAAAPAAVPAR